MSERDRTRFETVLVAPGDDRRPRLVAGLVVAVLAGSILIARLSPGAAPAEATATPHPRPSVAQVEPTATPLPAHEWFSAPDVPRYDVLVESGTVRWLRLASARLADETLARPGLDLLMLGTGRETVCLCWRTTGTEPGEPRRLELVRGDDHGERSRSTVTVVASVDVEGRPSGPSQVALAPSPDGRLAYLARVIRVGTRWTTSLDTIDLAIGSIVDTVDLDSIHWNDHVDVAANESPTLRIAPDGRHALVESVIGPPAAIGPSMGARGAWIVDLDGAAIGRVTVADAIAMGSVDAPAEPCPWIGFASPAIIAAGCHHLAATGGVEFEIRRFDLAGAALSAIPGDRSQPDPTAVLLDATAGVAYAWDPAGHVLFAADLVGGGWRSARPPADDLGDPVAIVVNSARPSPGPPTVWSDGRSATGPAVANRLVGSADGRLLFALGDGPSPGSTSGIWVFDARTLSLLERWPALATYDSLALFEDGHWLAAVGRPGVTPSGGPAEWGTSVTIHSASTGRPVLRIGDLGTDGPVTFPRSVTIAPEP